MKLGSLTGKENGRVQNIWSNISNLTMCVQKDRLGSGLTLVELDFKPQGTH